MPRKSRVSPSAPARRLAVAAVAAAACAAAGCAGLSPTGTGGTFQNTAPGVRYTGPDSCRPCHAEIAETFAHTGMGRAWYRMSRAVAVEDFSGRNEIEIPGTRLRYRMVGRDGRYWMRQFVLGSTGRETAVDEREMVWVVGSNNHSRSYVTLLGDKFFQMPVCWYPEESLWDLCPGYEHNNEHFAREIKESCVFCHNARMERTGGAFREPIPEGIDCERCHGPGEIHVERWSQEGARPSGKLDATIVNPRRLPPDRRIQVCFQCHLGDSLATQRTPRLDRTPEDFRPGQPIVEAFVPYRFAQPHEGDFGISAQADRFILSRCYRESGGRIECLTCHNPHVTVYSKDRPPEFFRRKCLSCHEVTACKAAEAARVATSPPDDCVACHMRKAEPDDHLHTTFTDHWIRKRIEPPREETRTRADMVASLPETLEQFSAAEQAYYGARASYLTAADVAVVRRELWSAAERDFRRAIELGMDRVEPWLYRGRSLGFLGRRDEALHAFEQARLRDPKHREAAYSLGQALAGRGRIAEAEEIFRRLAEEDPSDASALAELARCETSLGRIRQALDHYERALSLEPWQARLHHNRAMLLAALDRFDAASDAIATAVRLDPEDPELWQAAAQVLRRARRGGEAEEAERRAMALGKKTSTAGASGSMGR